MSCNGQKILERARVVLECAGVVLERARVVLVSPGYLRPQRLVNLSARVSLSLCKQTL